MMDDVSVERGEKGGRGLVREGMSRGYNVPAAYFEHPSRSQSPLQPPLTVALLPHTVFPPLVAVDRVILPNPSLIPQYFSALLLRYVDWVN